MSVIEMIMNLSLVLSLGLYEFHVETHLNWTRFDVGVCEERVPENNSFLIFISIFRREATFY